MFAINLLKEPILKNVMPEEKKWRTKEDSKEVKVARVKESKQEYVVNFKPELKVIIWVAKYLDRIGLDIP